MMRQCTLLFEQLEVAKAMRTFISHRMSDSEELSAKFEHMETDLVVSQKVVVERVEALKLVEEEKASVHVETNKLRNEGRNAEAKRKETEQENAQLKNEMEELRARFATQKKEMEELRARFEVQKKELEKEYQKQVDEIYFGDRCCMKKNDITQDIPSIPSDDEGEAPGDSS